jgi:hypothetical protein
VNVFEHPGSILLVVVPETRCAAVSSRGSRPGEQFLHHNHGDNALQAAFYCNALIVGAFE